MKVCIVDGCGKKQHVKIGYCSTHYRKFVAHGDPLGGRAGPTPGDPERWIHRALSGDIEQCLFWPYGKNRVGTGVVRWNGSLKTVYKVIGELRHGGAEAGQGYFHTCGNPRVCCNPKHIVLMDRAERKRKMASLWKKENREKAAEHNKKQYRRDPEKYRRLSRLYAANNRDIINARARRYVQAREQEDVVFKLRRRVSVLIKNGMLSNGFSKRGTKTEDILGCSIQDFRRHIELQFMEGMGWDNYGKWHLDHIVPVSSAGSEGEIYKLNHFTNLRPLWAEDNLSKGAKMEYLI